MRLGTGDSRVQGKRPAMPEQAGRGARSALLFRSCPPILTTATQIFSSMAKHKAQKMDREDFMQLTAEGLQRITRGERSPYPFGGILARGTRSR